MAEIILYVLLGIIGGALLLWLINQGQSRGQSNFRSQDELTSKLLQAEGDLRVANDRLQRYMEDVRTLETEKNLSQHQREQLSVQLTAATTRLEEQHRQAQELSQNLREQKEEVVSTSEKNQEQSRALAQLNAKIESQGNQINSLTQDVSTYKQELTKAQQVILATRERAVGLENENKYLKEQLENQKREIEEIGKRFTSEFKLLADSILEDKSKRFTEANQANIERLLKPLGENIVQFQRKVEEVYDRESKERFSLGKELERLMLLNQQISQEANNLTNALKGQVKQQGNWGEMILESILEKSGLTRDREYFVQESLRDEEGKRLQPDIIIAYPDNRKVIIDSKVSLVAYERYCSTDNAEEQSKALEEHLRSIRNHVESLRQKNYQDLVESLDFVMMFIPVEPGYMLAMQGGQDLWSYAYSRGVLLSSPTNLITALKLIYNLWQREYQNRHAMEIAERGGLLYDKFVGFVENLTSVGENLSRTQRSYTSAMGQLTEGSGNLVAQAHKLKTLGAKAKKSLPDEMINSLEQMVEGSGDE